MVPLELKFPSYSDLFRFLWPVFSLLNIEPQGASNGEEGCRGDGGWKDLSNVLFGGAMKALLAASYENFSIPEIVFSSFPNILASVSSAPNAIESFPVAVPTPTTSCKSS